MIWLALRALLVAGPAWAGPAGTEISKMEEQIAKLQADLAALAARVTALEGGPPAPTTYPVTLTTGGTGSGTVGFLGAPRRGTRTTREYAAGKIVTLTALPASGSTFTGWSPAPCAPRFTMPASALTCLGTFTATVVTPPPTAAGWERLPTGQDAMSTFRELHAGAVQHVLGLPAGLSRPDAADTPTLPRCYATEAEGNRVRQRAYRHRQLATGARSRLAVGSGCRAPRAAGTPSPAAARCRDA